MPSCLCILSCLFQSCLCPAALRSALTDEVERLRASATSLGREKAERDVELGEALTKVSEAVAES